MVMAVFKPFCILTPSCERLWEMNVCKMKGQFHLVCARQQTLKLMSELAYGYVRASEKDKWNDGDADAKLIHEIVSLMAHNGDAVHKQRLRYLENSLSLPKTFSVRTFYGSSSLNSLQLTLHGVDERKKINNHRTCFITTKIKCKYVKWRTSFSSHRKRRSRNGFFIVSANL